MTTNPFHYGTPVDAVHFAGREEELASLCARLEDGINVVVLSPRRYGKTSLLLRAEERLVSGGAALVHLNVLRCRDALDLAGRLAGAAFALPGRWHRARSAAADFARRLRITPTVTLAPDGTPRFGFAGDLAVRDADTVIGDVYALLGELARSRPAGLVLDEFQAITDHGPHLPGELKALADEHPPRVSLVLAGSRAHLMERLTGGTGAPLYGMAERLALGPVQPAAMAAYLGARAEAGGRPMSDTTATTVVEQAGPVPNDIQRLAYAAFAVADRRIGVDDVEAGLAVTVAHDAATFADSFGRLAPGQRRLLAVLAADPSAGAEPYSARVVRAVRLANAGSVRRAVEALSANDVIVQREGRWVVGDPFLRTWLDGL